MSTKKVAAISSIAVAMALCGWWLYSSMYAGPRDKLRTELQRLENDNTSFETALAEAPRVRAELKKRAEGSMSGPLDQVDHELRVAIRAMAERAGLAEIVVTTVEPDWPANPYSRARKVRSGAIRTALRGQRDFGVLKIELRAFGNAPQVLRAIALIQGQSWVQRIRSVSIEPRADNRSRLELRVGLSALYIPDHGRPVLPEVMPADEELASVWQPIAIKNVFNFVPPAPPVDPPVQPAAVAEAPVQPVLPPSPPYHHWRVTSIIVRPSAEGPGAIEVGLTNTAGEPPLTLTPGGSVLSATLVSASPDAATFEIAGETFAVALGQDLSQRQSLESIH